MGALVISGLAAVLLGAMMPMTPVSAAQPPACVADLPAAERGAAAVEALGGDLPDAARAAGLGVTQYERTLRQDRSMWVDECGLTFYVEPIGQVESATTSEEAPEATAPDALALQSRPGADRTIYLDFDGEQIADTGWNDQYNQGLPFTAEPYSKDADPAFSETERAVIAQVWAQVAEDYAPFDVNVTTQDPGQDALTRSNAGDLQFGSRVLITNTSTVYSSCTCGGIAYLRAFARTVNHSYTQPALVFTRGVGTGAKKIAEAASHEAGHNLGLRHDGTSSLSYYRGHGSWAPIMGVGYDRPVSQWSRGEYSGASNREDDLSVIAANGAPAITDEVGDDADDAKAIESGTYPGLIETAADTDWFRFTGSGTTTLQTKPAALSPNLDVALTLYDAQGTAIATSDPAVTYVNKLTAKGLDASIDLTLEPGDYFVKIDGAGYGSPLTTGYSDYGSLGRYELTLATNRPPVIIQDATPAAGQVGTAYSYDFTASRGKQPYTWTVTSGALPAGLTLDQTGRLSGTPQVAGTFSADVSVRDAWGSSASTSVVIEIAAAPTPPPAAPVEQPATPTAPTAKPTRPKPASQQNVAPLRITTRRLPVAHVGKRYSVRLGATLDRGRWMRSLGELPNQMRLTKSGILRGTPTRGGRYAFVVSVGSGALRTQKAMVLRVRR